MMLLLYGMQKFDGETWQKLVTSQVKHAKLVMKLMIWWISPTHKYIQHNSKILLIS